MPESAAVIARVLAQTTASLEDAQRRREQTGRATNPHVAYAIVFAKHFGAEIRESLAGEFGNDFLRSGEILSDSAEGEKRVDVTYTRPQSGLGIGVSLKSVHQGERDNGNARFTHNLKRNDEELRVEATALHVRQPYAVLVAVMILPFESCGDAWPQAGTNERVSSFGRWVQKFWSLRGRQEPEDPPNLFELVYIALYKRDGSELGFYQVGGEVPCPREGIPDRLLSWDQFIDSVRTTYNKRNQKDFRFAD